MNNFDKKIKLGKDEESGLDKYALVVGESYNYEQNQVSIYFKEVLASGDKILPVAAHSTQIILKDKPAVMGTRKNKKGKDEEYEVSPAMNDYTDFCNTNDAGRDKIIEKKIKEKMLQK